MASGTKHVWTFRARFRRHAFGWRSHPAIKRVKEAVAEIKKTARKDPLLGAEGAVLFLEKVSPAIEQVDSSSGAIGTAVNHAIDALVSIIAGAPVDGTVRDKWLERLWQAVEDDDVPYIETLPDHWGALCVTPERASRWADEFIPIARRTWSPKPELRGYFKGTAACLSALLKAGRTAELMALLELAPHKFWHDRKWGVKALLAMGKKAEALRFAEDSRGLNESDLMISEACEEILLASGMAEEAYNRYAFEANQKTTYLATYRAIIKKYQNKKPVDILKDLVAGTPGNEGKWFAAAKSAGLYDEAIGLANRTPCDPKTLTRAARDMAETEPRFAVEAGVAALRWLVEGYGYEITGLDVRAAYDYTMKAAVNSGCKPEAFNRIRELVAAENFGERFVTKILGHELGLK
ncbi:MAG: hypothetical protein JRK53_08245 [Deltaproteobacteria bacterium]|nr:hypothetical protein [Deltaproteobacteria bacterium]MBW1816848.1 hypothetical protein [Deltaproteobacteria bacterium]MBW2284660.1 hypothetical protein [Deltaproteobacteria bacterium]